MDTQDRDGSELSARGAGSVARPLPTSRRLPFSRTDLTLRNRNRRPHKHLSVGATLLGDQDWYI